jgi:hypothetical protein
MATELISRHVAVFAGSGSTAKLKVKLVLHHQQKRKPNVAVEGRGGVA